VLALAPRGLINDDNVRLWLGPVRCADGALLTDGVSTAEPDAQFVRELAAEQPGRVPLFNPLWRHLDEYPLQQLDVLAFELPRFDHLVVQRA